MQRPPECPCGLDGEIALITGGATGIGYGIAKAFTAMGAKVVLARWQDDVERAGGGQRRSTAMSGQQPEIAAARGSCTPSL
ncbi:MAG: SDR family NAD(P)-dependent oxidoreductase [SAR324 cluster bacterium]|nr:SDR family NAD(P)-dependent oxidoreductase [SAR324 cluster bacterium]